MKDNIISNLLFVLGLVILIIGIIVLFNDADEYDRFCQTRGYNQGGYLLSFDIDMGEISCSSKIINSNGSIQYKEEIFTFESFKEERKR